MARALAAAVLLTTAAGAAFAQTVEDHPRTCFWGYWVIPDVATLSWEWRDQIVYATADPSDAARMAALRAAWDPFAREMATMRPDLARTYYFFSDYYWGLDTELPVPPERVPELIRLTREAQERYYTSQGVTTLPYICAVKYVGDRERRTGVWALYDNWERYAPVFHLGPKPAQDPWEWRQRDGGWKYTHGGTGEEFTAWLGSAADPDYVRFKASCVRTIAESGCNGLFIDNPFERGRRPAHQESFRRWLAAKYPLDEIERMFGTRELAQLQMGEGESWPSTPLDVESWLWQWEMQAGFFAAMKAAGEEVWGAGNFPVSANGTAIDVKPGPNGSLETWAAGGETIGFAERRTTWLGDWQRPVGGGFHQREHADHIPGYLACRGVGAGELYCMPEWNPTITNTAATYRLAFAEALAYDGIYCDLQFTGRTVGNDPEVEAERHVWFPWLNEHRDLYAGSRSAARVAIVCPSTEFLINPQFEYEWRLWVQTLLDHQVPFDILMGNNLSAETLTRYDLLIVPYVTGMERESADALRAATNRGVQVLVLGTAATRRVNGFPHAEGLLADVLPTSTDPDVLEVRAGADGGNLWRRLRPLSFGALELSYNLPAYQPPLYHRYGGKRYSHTEALVRAQMTDEALSILDRVCGRSLSVAAERADPRLRISLYRQTAAGHPRRLLLHAINHSVQVALHEAPIAYEWREGTTPVVEPVAGFTAVVELPAGTRAEVVRWHTPEGESRELAFDAGARTVRFTLPELRTYGVAEIVLAEDAGAAQGADLPTSFPRTRERSPYAIDEAAMARMVPLAPEAETAEPEGRLLLRANHQYLVQVAAGDRVRATITGHEFESPTDAELRARETESLDLMPEGGGGFSTGPWVRWFLIGPDGAILADGGVPCDQIAEIDVPVPSAGIALLHVDAGTNEAEVHIANQRWVIPCMDTNRLFVHRFERPLYFYVRAGAAVVPLSLGTYDGEAQIILTSPTGRRVERRPVDPRIVAPLQVPVQAGEDDGVWTLEVHQTRFEGPLSTFTLLIDDPDLCYVATAPGRLLGTR
ncbi:MAG: hypothetical protein AB7Y46_04990 [Armatimonadota bacterium]